MSRHSNKPEIIPHPHPALRRCIETLTDAGIHTVMSGVVDGVFYIDLAEPPPASSSSPPAPWLLSYTHMLAFAAFARDEPLTLTMDADAIAQCVKSNTAPDVPPNYMEWAFQDERQSRFKLLSQGPRRLMCKLQEGLSTEVISELVVWLTSKR